MPGCSGGPVVTNARVYYTTRAAAGASAPGIPHALVNSGRTNLSKTRTHCAAGMRSRIPPSRTLIRPSLRAKRSNPALVPRRRKLDCVVASLLATTVSKCLCSLKRESGIRNGRAQRPVPFVARHGHASFPAYGTAKKVIVACANCTRPAVVGTSAMAGSSPLAESSSPRPFSRTRSSSKLAASSV